MQGRRAARGIAYRGDMPAVRAALQQHPPEHASLTCRQAAWTNKSAPRKDISGVVKGTTRAVRDRVGCDVRVCAITVSPRLSRAREAMLMQRRLCDGAG